MGYSHKWSRKTELDKKKFTRVQEDFKTILHALEIKGIPLAGSMGNGQPTVDNEKIAFNGVEKCGHKVQNLGITWPSDSACCVSEDGKADVDGSWFAGAQLGSRCCGGDCSHESFVLPRVFTLPEWRLEPNEKGLHFDFCKTAYKPYDIAVTACLIIAKHHLGNDIEVRSDGEEKDWIDAMLLCEENLGYGNEFRLDR
jgi:hypothetical protein